MIRAHPRLPQMTSLGSGEAVAIQAVLSWWIMDVDATACPLHVELSCRCYMLKKDVLCHMDTQWLLLHVIRGLNSGADGFLGLSVSQILKPCAICSSRSM